MPTQRGKITQLTSQNKVLRDTNTTLLRTIDVLEVAALDHQVSMDIKDKYVDRLLVHQKYLNNKNEVLEKTLKFYLPDVEE